jgi:hypothetical protein
MKGDMKVELTSSRPLRWWLAVTTLRDATPKGLHCFDVSTLTSSLCSPHLIALDLSRAEASLLWCRWSTFFVLSEQALLLLSLLPRTLTKVQEQQLSDYTVAILSAS